MTRFSIIVWAVVVLIVTAGLLAWRPWALVSLEKASVVWPVANHSSAPAAVKNDVMAIIVSGDGGWANSDRQLGTAFINQGIPVLGVNTFKYYWRGRDPGQTAQELDALMTKYLGAWGKRRIWLIGFSFGADVLPTLVDKLSPTNRARISQLVLLSPGRDVTFEIELEGYISKQGWLKQSVRNVMQRINPVEHHDPLLRLQALHGKPPVVCYYGLEDAADSLCDLPGVPAWTTVHAKNGGHHFDGGYQLLAKQMLEELPDS